MSNVVQLPWQQRQFSSYIRTRYYAGGWEFETAEQARTYVDQQFAKYPKADLDNTSFSFSVQDNGVDVAGVVSPRLGTRITTRTYVKGDTLRDRTYVASPSDCVWLIPGSEW